MERRYFLLVFLVLIIGSVFASPLNVTAKEKTIKCGDILTRNTILKTDLACGANALIIGSNNITLDCNGHNISTISLQGQTIDASGITLNNIQGTTIRNCKVSGYHYGIYFNNSQNNQIYNNIFDNNINAYETENSFSNEWDLNSWQTGNGWFDLENNSGYPNYYEISGPGNGRDNYPIPTNPNNVVAMPVASQESGNVNYLSFVSLSTTTPGATIRFTTDGTTPTETSEIYSQPILINHSFTLKVKAFKLGYYSSNVSSYFYIIQTVSNPVASYESGDLNYLSEVVLSTTTPQSTIRYTIDGNEPNENSQIYVSPIVISQIVTLKAKAYRNGFVPSSVVTYNYVIHTVANPVSSVPSGNINNVTQLTLSTTTPQATIRYTIDGSIPNENSQIYVSPITIDQNFTLRAKAYREEYAPSQVVTYNYVFFFIQLFCGDTISSNTILTQDINCQEEQWVALTVSVDNITIDCNNHTINGSPGIDDWGINIIGRNGITIKNCIFTNLNFPIYHEDGSFNRIIDNNFWYTRHGPVLRKGNHNLISGNIVTGAEMDGIGVVGYLNDGIPSTDNNVINNTLLSCGSDYASMEISYGSNNLIRDNFIQATGQYDSSGIMLSAFSSNNLIEHNDINNGDYGIWVAWGSSNNLIKDNRISNSLYNGLYLDSEVYNNVVTHNDFLNNASQAYQEADSTNAWSQNGIGNYWHNHNCIDINVPIGICDNPFYLPGGQDNFPLASPVWGGDANRTVFPKTDIIAKPVKEKEIISKKKSKPILVSKK